jgi:hypothetical protein
MLILGIGYTLYGSTTHGSSTGPKWTTDGVVNHPLETPVLVPKRGDSRGTPFEHFRWFLTCRSTMLQTYRYRHIRYMVLQGPPTYGYPHSSVTLRKGL